MNHFKATTILLTIIGILLFVDCRKTDNSTDTDPGQGAKQRREQVDPLTIDTYYLRMDSNLVKIIIHYPDKELYCLPHKGAYEFTDLRSDVLLRKAYSKLLTKVILESTDRQSACRILKEYYLNSELLYPHPGHYLYINEDNNYIRMMNRMDSIFGLKVLRYNDSINERWVLIPYNYKNIHPDSLHFSAFFLVNPRYILPKYNKEALDEYCKLPCDSLILLLKEIVNTPSDYYYIPPIKE